MTAPAPAWLDELRLEPGPPYQAMGTHALDLVDWLVTERGVYRRDGAKLAFLGEPPAGEPSRLASPVCYGSEIAPGYFGER